MGLPNAPRSICMKSLQVFVRTLPRSYLHTNLCSKTIICHKYPSSPSNVNHIRNKPVLAPPLLHFGTTRLVQQAYYEPLTSSTPTIFALSTGISSKAAIAVVLTLLTDKPLPTPRVFSLRTLRNPQTKEVLDSAGVLWLPHPNTFTGEDSVELHLHGGKAVVMETLQTLRSLPSLSPAKPGEFTRRAFENGKMDLTAVEGLGDLIAADTSAQRRQALRALQGETREVYQRWKEGIVRSVAHVEAVLDFGEDEEISDEVAQQVSGNVQRILNEISVHLADNRRGERLREGAQLVIVGPPNAGKSSLINLLANREAAIVSPIPGTTRDVIEVTFDMGGYPVVCGDTAGIHLSSDTIESEGIRRAYERFKKADLKVVVLDSSATSLDPLIKNLITPESIVVLNKCDLNSSQVLENEIREVYSGNIWKISCLNRQGFEEFIEGLQHQVKQNFEEDGGEPPLITRARHREELTACAEALTLFLQELPRDLVIAAEELRGAVKSIGRLTGRVETDDVLEVIFAEFCIGK